MPFRHMMDEPGMGLWPTLLAGSQGAGDEGLDVSEDQLALLDDLIGPVLSRHLLYNSGLNLADREASQSRLMNRFRRADGLRWALDAANHGFEIVCLKGMAATHFLYSSVDLRTMADADLLVRKTDCDRLVRHYQAAGLDFHDGLPDSRWGHIADASLIPLTGSDGASNVDLHIHPDAWPLHLGLSTEDVFAAATWVKTGEGRILVPSMTHMLLLSASHAARDLFGPSTAKSLIDAARLLAQFGGQVDWTEFEARDRRGRMLKPACAFLAILDHLGADTRAVPRHLKHPPAGGEFRRALHDYVTLFAKDRSAFGKARREWLLCAEPGVALRRNLKRLIGLFRPHRGLRG